MCDYSLHLVASRAAKVGDELVTTKFNNSITRGFAAIGEPNVAVCLLPGTEVAFEKEVSFDRVVGIFPRRKLAEKVARFRQINVGQSERTSRCAGVSRRGDRAAHPAVRRPARDRAAVAGFSAPCEGSGGAEARFARQVIGLLTIERSWERKKTGAGSAPAVERLIATNATPQKKEAPKKEGPETPPDSPPLDLSDAAVKKLIRSAKLYVTHDQINSVLPSEKVNSEQIEDVLADVVETEEATADEERQREEPDEEPESKGGELVEVHQTVPAKSEAKEPTERTDDPVRMYLREMGLLELLSREGEIAIAKRIEAGREAMIAGLCESPLTFQAIIIWRDELNEGKVFLRDIIDLEATYAGPDAKAMPAPVDRP